MIFENVLVCNWLAGSQYPPASSFWPRLANPTRAWLLRSPCAPSFSRWATRTAASSVPAGALDQRRFSWDLCSDLVQSENALTKDLP